MTITDDTAQASGLRDVTDEELNALYAAADDLTRAAVQREADRRDREDRLARTRAKGADMYAEGERAAYAQYRQAEEFCRGRMLSQAGMAAHDRGVFTDEFALWRMPADKAELYGSEEVRDFWLFVAPRLTPAAYVRQRAAERRGEYQQARDAREARNGMGGHEAGALRREATADETPQGTGRPVLSGRRPASQDTGASQDRTAGRPAGPVQRGDVMAEVCGAHDARVGTSKQCGNCRRPQDGAAKRRAAGTVAVLDGQVMQRQRQQPAGQQIDGAAVLNFTRRYLGHYVSFPSEAALTAAVAWIGHAVARDRDDKGVGQLIWRASPRLLVTSRKRGSGKSTLLDAIVNLTQARDGKMPKITPRAIAETVGQHYDVAVLDEAESIFGQGAKNVELQGCLLAGYTKRTNYRVCGKSIPLFGAVAYAGKDKLITDTKGEQIGDLLDRSMILRFKAPDQAPPEMDEIAEDDADLLASALVAWTDSCRDQLRQAARDIAAEDRDTERAGDLRSMQIWRPLRAICRVADGLTAEELAEGKRGPWETAIDEASWELTAGAAGVEAQETLDELGRRAQAWGAQDEPGEIVTEPGYDEDDF